MTYILSGVSDGHRVCEHGVILHDLFDTKGSKVSLALPGHFLEATRTYIRLDAPLGRTHGTDTGSVRWCVWDEADARWLSYRAGRGWLEGLRLQRVSAALAVFWW